MPSTKIKWIVISVVVPLLVALIAIVPPLLKKESPSISIKSGDIEQSSGSGNNINNVAGDVVIFPFPQKTDKEK